MANDPAIKLLRQINSLLLMGPQDRWNHDSDLTIAQIFLLNELLGMYAEFQGPVGVSALTSRTGLSKATVSSMLKSLKKAGYIRMQMDDADNRRKEITLTAKALAARPKVVEFVQGVNETVCRGLTDRDREALETALQRILANIQHARPEA